MRFLTLVLAFGACATPDLCAADEFTVEKAKALISEASGMPADELAEFSTAPVFDPDLLRASRGQTLVWWVLVEAPATAPEEPSSFEFAGNGNRKRINPAYFADMIAGPKGKDGQRRKIATVIRLEYITNCTCKVVGDTATGVVSFKAEKLYEGKIEYTARKKDGKWRIEEFCLPDRKVTLALGADGKWVKK